MSSTLGASLLRTVLSDGTLKILGSGLDKGPIIELQFSWRNRYNVAVIDTRTTNLEIGKRSG